MIDKLDIGVINSLTISELYVLRYIDNNKEKVLSSSVKSIAENSFVSTATVMRVCKKLGFSGFSEFKYALKKELLEETEKSASFSDDFTINEIKGTLVSEIETTARSVDKDTILSIVNLIKSDKTLHFFAKGLTLNVLEYAAKQLRTAQRPVHLYNDTHIAYINAENFTKDDCVFLASLSGKTHQVVRVAQIAKSRGATIVTITGRLEDELSKIGDINIKVANERMGTTKHDFSSRLGMIFIMDIIISVYLKSQLEK
ncbi:MAG: MurR/RpiR family transcriptional regulator [Acholeplasmataceae bacterium]